MDSAAQGVKRWGNPSTKASHHAYGHPTGPANMIALKINGPHEVQQIQASPLSLDIPKWEYRLRLIERSPSKKNLRVLMDGKLGRSQKCAESTCEACPGLHPKLHEQQVKGGDCVPLPCPCDTPPAVLLWDSVDLSEQAQRRPQKWSEGWSISPLRTGWESWNCSSWRRKGSRVTLQLLSVPMSSL